MSMLTKKYEWNPVPLIKLVNATGCAKDSIARACNLSLSSLTKYLDGTTAPSMSAVLNMADYFAVPVDVILGRATSEELEEIYKNYSSHFMEMRRAPFESYLFRHSTQIEAENRENPYDMPLDYTLNDAPFPYNLITDIFGSPMIEIMDEDHEAGLHKALTVLNERERECIYMIYRDGMTLEESAGVLGLSKERTRQILKKSIRKLRHPYYQQFIKLGVEGVEEKKDFERRKNELERKEAILSEREAVLKRAFEVIGFVAKQYEYEPEETAENLTDEEILDKMPIDELDLSVRSFNCLKRANINTFKDLRERASRGNMINIRNLGRRSVGEILDKLLYFGYDYREINSEFNADKVS